MTALRQSLIWGVFALGTLFFTPLSAQSVRPVIVEYKGSAKGKFELTNVSSATVNVFLEPKSFRISEDGNGVFSPLDSRIHLKLSAMSVRIPPKQSRYVFYEATADMAPAWFTIYSVFGMTHSGGANLQVELPHTVYLLQKEPLQKKDVAIESATYSQEDHQLSLRLVNTGPDLGRVLDCEARGHKQKVDEPGFPLLPGSHRSVEIKWAGDTPPESVAIHFANFALEQDLRVQAK